MKHTISNTSDSFDKENVKKQISVEIRGTKVYLLNIQINMLLNESSYFSFYYIFHRCYIDLRYNDLRIKRILYYLITILV